jgi:hypothetical protein
MAAASLPRLSKEAAASSRPVTLAFPDRCHPGIEHERRYSQAQTRLTDAIVTGGADVTPPSLAPHAFAQP